MIFIVPGKTHRSQADEGKTRKAVQKRQTKSKEQKQKSRIQDQKQSSKLIEAKRREHMETTREKRWDKGTLAN